MEEIIFASATTLARAIREQQVSSQEVVDAYLNRIAAINPALNAVVQLRAEAARAEARQADEALARGESKGLLHGVPFTIKDTFDVAGMICTCGTTGCYGSGSHARSRRDCARADQSSRAVPGL